MINYPKAALSVLLYWLLISNVHGQSANQIFSLDQAIRYALENNPELSVMQARIEQANAHMGMSLASFYPQLKAGLSYQHSDNPAQAFAMIIAQRRLDLTGTTDFNHPGGVDNYRPQLTANYALFRGGQDYYLSRAAELGVEASEFENSAVRNRLIDHVSITFYGQLAANEAHKLSQRSVQAVESELNQSRVKYEAGVLLKSDVLSLEVQLAEAKDAEIKAANAIELANTMLKTLLGMPSSEAFQIQSNEGSNPAVLAESFEQLLEQAQVRHPELKAAEKRIAIAEQQLNAAQAAHLPRADAYVSYGADSKDLAFSGNRDNVSAGVQVEVDLFSGFATQQKINKAEHQLAEAREALRQTRLRIENAVKTSQLKYQEAFNRLQVASATVKAAEEAFRLVNEQRQAGVVTITRYIEAEVAHDKAKTRQINARFDALCAEADLKLATGFWQ